RQRRRPRAEKAQRGFGKGAIELAVHLESRSHVAVERRYADVLCHRCQGGHPLQVGRQPRGESDRDGAGEADPRSGKRREEAGTLRQTPGQMPNQSSYRTETAPSFCVTSNFQVWPRTSWFVMLARRLLPGDTSASGLSQSRTLA